MATGRPDTSLNWKHVRATAVLATMVPSAWLMAVAESAAYAGLAWICLIPLFYAIRRFSPLAAMWCGGVWGFSLYFFSAIGGASAISPTDLSLILLTTIPALYSGVAGLVTRTIGFSPTLLAVGWILVEVALRPVGLEYGLLGSTQIGSVYVGWMGDLLGYGFIAFAVAGINVSLLALLDILQFRLPRSGIVVEAGIHIGRLAVANAPYFPRVHRRGVNPRAPPASSPC